MSFLGRLFGRKPPEPDDPEEDPNPEAVIVRLPVEGVAPSELWDIEDLLIEAVEAASVGEVDGTETGVGGATFFLYGPDAERLFATVRPIFQADPRWRNAVAEVRRGGPELEGRRVPISGS